MTILEVGSEKQYTTIGGAINAASSGDTIKISSGTYNETITLAKSNITIQRENVDSVVNVTNGIIISNVSNTQGISDITFDGLVLTGNPSGGTHAIIDLLIATKPVINLTLINCTMDGERKANRLCLFAKTLSGVWRIENCIIKNFPVYYIMDNTGFLYTSAESVLTEVIFKNNTCLYNSGSIAFRGNLITPMTKVTIEGNIMTNWINSFGSGGWIWAALEIYNTAELIIKDNIITDIPDQYNLDGYAIKCWAAIQKETTLAENFSWKLTVTGNDFSRNAGAIWIPTHLHDVCFYNYYMPDITSRIHNNIFIDNRYHWIVAVDEVNGQRTPFDEYGLLIEDNTEYYSGFIDCTNNWFGSEGGPFVPSSFNILYDPWSADSTFSTRMILFEQPPTLIKLDANTASVPSVSVSRSIAKKAGAALIDQTSSGTSRFGEKSGGTEAYLKAKKAALASKSMASVTVRVRR